ncbi:hypothetical protein CSPAE12_09203 [Colletotrichum incanum]|nr:hypothetical protein CSPAE12_09203 [Colletotrichum incanum]
MNIINDFAIRRKPVANTTTAGKGYATLGAGTTSVPAKADTVHIIKNSNTATKTMRSTGIEVDENQEELDRRNQSQHEFRPRRPPSSQPTSSSTSTNFMTSDDSQFESQPTKIDMETNHREDGHFSFYFSRLSLVGLATTFITMIVALEVLNLASERNKGIAPIDERNHYLWTYGPTFILTLFVALWGQLTHLKASYSIISPPSRLFDFTSILGSLTLRALVIVSTGLLSAAQQTMVEDVTITMLDQFNMSRKILNSAVDAGVTIWGVHQRGVAYPPGTTEKVAAQSFLVSGYEDKHTVSAPVVVFEADFESCYEFSWTFPMANLSIASLARVASDSERAIFANYCQQPSSYDRLPMLEAGAASLFWTQTIDKCLDEEKDEYSHRVYASIIYNITNELICAPSMLCTPKYTLTRRKVTIISQSEKAGRVLAIDDEILEHIPMGVSNLNFTNFVIESISSATQMPSYRQGVPVSQTTLWWSVMNFTDPQPRRADLGSSSKFPELFRRMYKLSLLSKRTESVTEALSGISRHDSNRLVVEKLPLRVMESLLALLTGISLAFCFFPLTSLPTRSGFMLTLALIFNRSPQFLQVLTGTGKMTKLLLRSRLHNFRFYLLSGNTTTQIRIGVQPKKAKLTAPSKVDAVAGEQWRKPMATSLIYKSCLIAVTIFIVVTLEVLLQYSLKHGGVASVSMEGYMKYGWLFLPPLVMGSLALAYNTVDTTNRLLHPFQQLRDARSPNFLAIRYDPLGKLTATAIAHAIKCRYFALAAGMFTSLLGPILTIAASGLYSVSLVPGIQRTEVSLTGWFDVSTASLNHSMYIANPVPNYTDAAMSQAILFNNVSYMKGTYESFAFPRMELPPHLTENAKDNASTNESSRSSSLTVRLSAVRGQLNCTKYFSARGQQYFNRTHPPYMDSYRSASKMCSPTSTKHHRWEGSK